MSLCACASIQNLPDPLISARHTPGSGATSVTILPQFNSVISVVADGATMVPPEGCRRISVVPFVSTENAKVIRLVAESTGILNICGFPLITPVAQRTVPTLFLV